MNGDTTRYQRQIQIPEFGTAGQKKLTDSKVLVIGAGGLGTPVLQYLTAMGVGTMGIVEFDKVDESNLHRQVLYEPADIGKAKIKVAASRMTALNPQVKILAFEEVLTTTNALAIFSKFDLVIDGSDNLPTRYLVNDACVLCAKPFVYGAIFQFEGQVSVFNQLGADGQRGPTYRDLFPTPPPPHMVPSCSEGGVLGVLPGIIGSMMANEAVKILAGIGKTLSGRLVMFDSLECTTRYVKIQSNPLVEPITNLVDYEAFCHPASVTEIAPREALALMTAGTVQLIDVRELWEFEENNVGGINIPLHELQAKAGQLPKEPILLICQTGQRSQKAIKILQQEGFLEAWSIAGGITKWRMVFD